MTFIGLSLKEEMQIFGIINSKAKGLNRSLLDFHESKLVEDMSKIRPALYIAVRLNDDAESPWFGQLSLGGANTNILLIEPSYKNKYPPLGLMKIAQYHGPRGKRDNVNFVKGEDKKVLDTCWDRIYVTTLFSFEWKRISQAIDFAVEASAGQHQNIFVGGIAASLMQEEFLKEPRWRGIRFIKGLLNTPPAPSLQLDSFEEELYSASRAP